MRLTDRKLSDTEEPGTFYFPSEMSICARVFAVPESPSFVNHTGCSLEEKNEIFKLKDQFAVN